MPNLFKRFSLSPRTRRWIAGSLATVAVLWLGCAAFIWHAMHEPPEEFGRVMMKLPGPVPFLLFPFETMWLRARAGTLHIGDPAPNFTLTKVDKSAQVELSALNQQKPVVLIFGSYT